jgi:hypothetical protein
MAEETREFATEAEANAFQLGVEFTVLWTSMGHYVSSDKPRRKDDKWTVFLAMSE